MSDEVKWTSGPWQLDYEEDDGDLVLSMGTAIEDPAMFDSAHQITLYGRIYEEEAQEQFAEMMANGRLIAAAPDLFTALERLVDEHSMSYPIRRDALVNARAALAKAKEEA